MAGLPDKYVHRFRADDLTALLDRAHLVHEDRMERIRAGLPLRM